MLVPQLVESPHKPLTRFLTCVALGLDVDHVAWASFIWVLGSDEYS